MVQIVTRITKLKFALTRTIQGCTGTTRFVIRKVPANFDLACGRSVFTYLLGRMAKSSKLKAQCLAARTCREAGQTHLLEPIGFDYLALFTTARCYCHQIHFINILAR